MLRTILYFSLKNNLNIINIINYFSFYYRSVIVALSFLSIAKECSKYQNEYDGETKWYSDFKLVFLLLMFSINLIYYITYTHLLYHGILWLLKKFLRKFNCKRKCQKCDATKEKCYTKAEETEKSLRTWTIKDCILKTLDKYKYEDIFLIEDEK